MESDGHSTSLNPDEAGNENSAPNIVGETAQANKTNHSWCAAWL
jgi:hypothetical protein